MHDYSKGEVVYYQLTDRNVKIMHKGTYNWEPMEINLVKITKENFQVKSLAQCCTKR